jgi:hypothetical protein
VNVTFDDLGSGTFGFPAVSGVAKKPLPWFVPSYVY